MNENEQTENRRSFLKATGLAAAATAIPASALGANGANSSAKAEIKVALIGCGGRGKGAITQSLKVEGTKLVAIADAFEDQLKKAHTYVSEAFKDKVDVPKSRQFVGFDAYKGAIDAADLVILTTPPGFRPIHFEYAVSQGKHVFMEKPVAVDAEGIKKVIEAAKIADKKGLKVVCGLQRRYDPKYIETAKRIHDGAIGDLTSAQCYWNSGGVWVRNRQPGMTEMEYQMRNWYYFNWLCGDHIVEQHVHQLDVVNWFMGDNTPTSVQGMGGRQVRVGKDFGEIYDHHYVEMTYGNGAIVNSQCRHIRRCMIKVTESFRGTKGSAKAGLLLDNDGKEIWKFEGKSLNPYQVEHDELVRHIRQDIPINNAYYGATSTMTGIIGRMATYSGKELQWEKALADGRSITPKKFAWDADPGPKAGKDGIYPCPVPGVTKVI